MRTFTILIPIEVLVMDGEPLRMVWDSIRSHGPYPQNLGGGYSYKFRPDKLRLCDFERAANRDGGSL